MPEDSPAIATIYNRYVLESTATFELTPVDAASVVERMAHSPSGLRWLVVEVSAGRVVGYASVAPWKPRGAYARTLAHTVARRVGRLLEREGLLERDTEQLALGEALDTDDPMPDLAGHSITYRIAVGPHLGRKVFTLQTLPDSGWDDESADAPGNVAGFSLHAGVAVKACQRKKLERLCRYICRPPVIERIPTHLANKDLPGLGAESRAPPAERSGMQH